MADTKVIYGYNFVAPLNSFDSILQDFNKSSVIMQKGESQNRGNKKTKDSKFSGKQTLLHPHTHMYVCVSGVRNVCFSENFAYVLNNGPLPKMLILDVATEIPAAFVAKHEYFPDFHLSASFIIKCCFFSSIMILSVACNILLFHFHNNFT